MRLRPTLPFLLLLLAAPLAQAQPAPDGDGLGYVNPRLVEGWFDQPAKVEVNLDGTLLRMVSAGLESDAGDDEQHRALAIIKRISGLYVRVYDAGDDVPAEAFEAHSSELIDRLGREGWETVVRVREAEQQVSVQLRPRGENAVAGLVVLVAEANGENVFVNLVGDIAPEDVATLAGSLNGLDRLDGLDALGNDRDNGRNSRDDESKNEDR